MADIMTGEQRSELMARVRSRHTKPEMMLRSALHRLGFRFSLNNKRLPGKPDIVLPKYKTAVFVHGCFWHGHTGCRRSSVPKTNTEFWTAKLERNKARDAENEAALAELGWNVVTVWECEIYGLLPDTMEKIVAKMLDKAEPEHRKTAAKNLNRLELAKAAEKKVRKRIDKSVDESSCGQRRKSKIKFTVVDLFSGAGGMSFGFHRHPKFDVIAAADAEFGKPSSGRGKLQCNTTYALNMGIVPVAVDLSAVEPASIREVLKLQDSTGIDILSVCPPCTGFSRANPLNHLRDDQRNSLVRKSAEFAVTLAADVVVMENARELIQGNFNHHYKWFKDYLEDNGYTVFGKNYLFTAFGLPQIRERSIVIAAKRKYRLHTLENLWEGWSLQEEVLTVRRAFSSIDPRSTGFRSYPKFASTSVKERIAAIPKNGGSWMDLLRIEGGARHLTPAMRQIVEEGKFGSYPDVYGRLHWDKPAPTIKRECSHIGNGRYTHPDENRLCTVREMAALQGFPNDFAFGGSSLSNLYRHIGDAVPPLISYQLASVSCWILTGKAPEMKDVLLPGTHLNFDDLLQTKTQECVNA